MAEQRHTPGPWVASKFGFQVLTGDSWNSICELKDGAEWEDGRGKYEPEYEWQNQEANARLIAAAPDMLAALKAAAGFCQRFLDTFGEVGDDATQANINDWNEIIAKAEGGAS